MFFKNKEIMNKSAVFRLKLLFPNVSGLALHQWNYQFVETIARFIYAIIILSYRTIYPENIAQFRIFYRTLSDGLI